MLPFALTLKSKQKNIYYSIYVAYTFLTITAFMPFRPR